MGCKSLEHLEVACRRSRAREMREDVLPGADAHAASSLWIGRQDVNRVSECRTVLGFDEHSSTCLFDDLASVSINGHNQRLLA
jgi:hypothetical protein